MATIKKIEIEKFLFDESIIKMESLEKVDSHAETLVLPVEYTRENSMIELLHKIGSDILLITIFERREKNESVENNKDGMG